MNMKNVLTVILGGGKGTRLFPLTKYRSKPAVPIAGKFRIIDITISNAINSGIRKIFILTQFNTHSLHRHIYDTYRLGRFTDGFVEILAAQQTAANMNWYQGTADAVRQNLNFFSNTKTKFTLILSGDHLYRMDYKKFLYNHLKQKAALSIAVKPVSKSEAPELGILQTDEKGRIIRFIEKPNKSELDSFKSPGLPEETPFLASLGIYLFNNDTLFENLNKTKEDDFGKHIIPMAIKESNVQAYYFNDYWRDIGTVEAFFHANLEMAKQNPPFTFHDNKAPFYTRPRYLPGSRLKNCHIDDTLIADGCYVEDSQIKNTVLGLRTMVKKGSSIEDCVVMGADYYEIGEEKKSIPMGIGENCVIKKAILDKNVRIGNNVQIINKNNIQKKDGEIYCIDDGIVIIPKNSIIPDNTII